jgi:hypothetical protein
MPTYYQYEHPDYGEMTYTLDGLMEELRNDIECNSFPPDELQFVVKVVEMSQEAYEALPTTDEIDEGRYS